MGAHTHSLFTVILDFTLMAETVIHYQPYQSIETKIFTVPSCNFQSLENRFHYHTLLFNTHLYLRFLATGGNVDSLFLAYVENSIPFGNTVFNRSEE